jgi:hypothetical protein
MFGVVQDMPAVTAEEYALVEKHLGPDRPPGLVSHVSGPMENGWRIINIWETEDAFRLFQSQRLLRAAGLAAQEGLDATKAARFSALTVSGSELAFR